MPWEFDCVEAFNIFFAGGLASLLFFLFTKFWQWGTFFFKYNHLNSKGELKDWKGYPMRKDNNRLPDFSKVQSKVNIRTQCGKFILELAHGDSIWKGEISMLSGNYGILTYHYLERFEFGRRECFVSNYVLDGEKYDYIFIVPITNKIYYQPETSEPLYDYGNEVLVRKSKS
jgi:hypothetical protein